MLLGSLPESALHLDDLWVGNGLCAQVDLDLMQLLPLSHDALQALLQDVLAEPTTPINGDRAEVLQPSRLILHQEHNPPPIQTTPKSTKHRCIARRRKIARAHTHLVDGPALGLSHLHALRSILKKHQNSKTETRRE